MNFMMGGCAVKDKSRPILEGKWEVSPGSQHVSDSVDV